MDAPIGVTQNILKPEQCLSFFFRIQYRYLSGSKQVAIQARKDIGVNSSAPFFPTLCTLSIHSVYSVLYSVKVR